MNLSNVNNLVCLSLQEAPNGFVITNVANQGGKTISLMTKHTVEMADAGTYQCTNKADSTDKDSTNVMVKGW